MVRYALLLLTALIYPVALLLRTLRFTKNRDPWRRIIGLGLRSEGTKFELSLFGLKGVPNRFVEADFLESDFAACYIRFLRDRPEASIALSHHRYWVERITTPELDFVFAEFAENGSLIRFKADLDPRSPLNLTIAVRSRVDEILLQAHRDTRHLPDAVRARELWRCVLAGIVRVSSEPDARTLQEYAGRLSRAWFLSIDTDNHNSQTRFHPPDQRFGRAVDLISVAPESPSGLFTDEELLAFARQFNTLAEAARTRISPTYRAMEQLAILPSWLAHYLLKYNRAKTRTVYGSVGLSMLRDASVFVAPMSDSGFDEGFLAIGSAALPTVSQGKVACITFKGPRERIAPTWTTLARIS
jgi:hypothetical protein